MLAVALTDQNNPKLNPKSLRIRFVYQQNTLGLSLAYL